MTGADPEVLVTNDQDRNDDGNNDDDNDGNGGDALSVDAAFLSRLARASALYDEGRLPEAELELGEAARLRPGDARPHRLLARVRLRLGRLADAQRAFATLVKLAPHDAHAHFELGLLALKAENHALAVTALSEATRLSPHDARAQEYLAVAWSELGASNRLAPPPPRAPSGADRRAGDVVAPVASALWPSRPGMPWPGEMALADLAAERLLPAGFPTQEGNNDRGARVAHLGAGIFRLPVEPESPAYVAPAALVALWGDLAAVPASRRRPGRVADVAAEESSDQVAQPPAGASHGAATPHLWRCEGQGEIWIGPTRGGRPVFALRLEDDALFVRESCVLGFSGSLGWDAGRFPVSAPRGDTPESSLNVEVGSAPGSTAAALLHFYGRGQVLVDWSPDDVVAVRVSAAAPAIVPEARLLGWLGQTVLRAHAEGVEGDDAGGAYRLITCEGEGVLLIARDGQAAQPIHQRAEPGDHGSGGADPADSVLHR